MPNKLEVNGHEYNVIGNPDMGTVKYVQEMEIEMMRKYLDDDTILELDQADDDDLMQEILEDADIEDFKQMMWERSIQEPIQTISLATNEKLDSSDVDDMKALDFKELLNESETALDGTATDFMDELGIGISSTVNRVEEMTEDSANTSQETPPAVSEISKRQSKGAGQTEPTTSTK